MLVTINEMVSMAGVGLGALTFIWKMHRENKAAVREAARLAAESAEKARRLAEESAEKAKRLAEDAAAERAVIKDRIDALWRLQFDRAGLVAERNDVGRSNSPFVVTAKVRQTVPNDLAAGFRSVYAALPEKDKTDDIALAVQLQKRFRKRIVDEMCRPHQWDSGECFLVAMAIAREAA